MGSGFLCSGGRARQGPVAQARWNMASMRARRKVGSSLVRGTERGARSCARCLEGTSSAGGACNRSLAPCYEMYGARENRIVHPIEMHFRNEVFGDSSDANATIITYLPSTKYRHNMTARGDWSEIRSTFLIPEKLLTSRIALRILTLFSGGKRIISEAKVFAPSKISFVMISQRRVEGRIFHEKQVNSNVGCELSCWGKKSKNGSDICIECHSSNGNIFKICC